MRLIYDRDLDPARAVPLSLSLALTKPHHRGRPVSNWLTGLLPDREAVLMGWRAQFGITDLHPKSLLTHIGEDVAGACQFVREERLDAFSQSESSQAGWPMAVVVELEELSRRARWLRRLPMDGVDPWVRIYGLSRLESFAEVERRCACWSGSYDFWLYPTTGGTLAPDYTGYTHPWRVPVTSEDAMDIFGDFTGASSNTLSGWNHDQSLIRRTVCRDRWGLRPGLWEQHAFDANPIQILTAAHPENAHDLSSWNTTEVSPGRAPSKPSPANLRT